MSPAPTRYAIVGIGVGVGVGVGGGVGVGVGETGALELPPHAYASSAGTISSRSHVLVPMQVAFTFNHIPVDLDCKTVQRFV